LGRTGWVGGQSKARHRREEQREQWSEEGGGRASKGMTIAAKGEREWKR
jgi:hypothetical protein